MGGEGAEAEISHQKISFEKQHHVKHASTHNTTAEHGENSKDSVERLCLTCLPIHSMCLLHSQAQLHSAPLAYPAHKEQEDNEDFFSWRHKAKKRTFWKKENRWLLRRNLVLYSPLITPLPHTLPQPRRPHTLGGCRHG